MLGALPSCIFPSFVKIDPQNFQALVRCCTEDCDAAAWTEFVRRVDPLIRSIVLRFCRRLNLTGREQVDDLIQETYVRLCAENYRILREFEWTGVDCFYAYLKVITANVVRDSAKARFAVKRGCQITDPLRIYCTPALQDHSELERDILLSEIYAAARRVSRGPAQQRDLLVFWLYYGLGFKGIEIARIPDIGLTQKGIESLLLRLVRAVRAQLRAEAGRLSNTVQ
jgi:RNA polymerase sigma-70 factor (ECF subfamily)